MRVCNTRVDGRTHGEIKMAAWRRLLRTLILEFLVLTVLLTGNGRPAPLLASSGGRTFTTEDSRDVRHGIEQVNGATAAGQTTSSTHGVGDNQFNGPYGIFVDKLGRIYVADTYNNRIVRADDMTGTGWVTLGTEGAGVNQFVHPGAIFVDGAGRIYVADEGNNRIVRVDDMTGAGWTTLGTPGSGVNHLNAPIGIFVDGVGRIYVSDGSKRIVRVNDIRGAGWTTLGADGSGVHQFGDLSAIFVDGENRIYVTDWAEQGIVRVNDMTGAGWTALGTQGPGVDQFNGPAGIFVDGTGRIYVADVGNSRIVRMNDMTGAGWTTVGAVGTGPNQFYEPRAVFVDGVGRIYAADAGDSLVVRMNDLRGTGWTTLGFVRMAIPYNGLSEPRRMPCGKYIVQASGEHSNMRVDILQGDAIVDTVEDFAITEMLCQPHLTGETPAVIILSYGGGANCCFEARVYRTDPWRRVLDYQSPPADGSAEVLTGVEGERRSVLLLDDASSGRFFDYLAVVFLPHIPLVACFSGERFQDCTQRYPSIVEKCETEYSEALTRALLHKWPWGDTGPVLVDLWASDAEILRVVALDKEVCGLIRGKDHLADITQEIAARTHDANLAEYVGAWLQKHHQDLVDWIRVRGQQLLQP